MTDLEAHDRVDGRDKPGHDGGESPATRKAIASPSRPWLKLSPMNRRRLDNFRRNRRGAWSLVDLPRPLRRSLCSEFIANDRPLIASYNGELLFPVFVDYPEDKFGGFQARADYRDPFVANEIEAHGWMIWPPIRFANSTTILDPPTPLPTPPTWMLSDAQCRAALDKAGREGRRDRGPAVPEARTSTGSAPIRTATTSSRASSTASASRCCSASSSPASRRSIGVFAGAVQGYFGGWLDLTMQRVIEIWSSLPHLYILIILSAILAPSFFVLLIDPAPVLLGQPRPCGAGRVPARAQFRICQRRARARPLQRQDHRQARAAERDGGDADLPALHRQFLDQHPDLARFPRPRHAAGLALARRTCCWRASRISRRRGSASPPSPSSR